ncbi:MAG: anti-sigma factor antagonist [Pseudonocardiaceae bacterium]|nr:anti-sigma factor antagonist [Pseudonocardiaceae bacterium]
MAEVLPFVRRPSPRRAVLDLHTRTMAGGAAVVSVAGEIDLANVADLRAALAAALADSGVQLLVCDLGRVSFLACSGLSALLDAKAALAERGGWIRLVATDPAVLRPLTMSGLLPTLPVSPDVITALR